MRGANTQDALDGASRAIDQLQAENLELKNQILEFERQARENIARISDLDKNCESLKNQLGSK